MTEPTEKPKTLQLSGRMRAAIVVFGVWFALIISRQLLRGNAIVPSGIEASSFWTIQVVIAALLAVVAYVIASIVGVLSDANK